MHVHFHFGVKGGEALGKGFRRRNFPRTLVKAGHMHMHVGIAKHDLPRRVGVAAKHIGLDNVKLRELFETQPGEVMDWLAATLHQEVGRNHLRSTASKRQLQYQNGDATQRWHPVAVPHLIPVTFLPGHFTFETAFVRNWLSSSNTDSWQAQLPRS